MCTACFVLRILSIGINVYLCALVCSECAVCVTPSTVKMQRNSSRWGTSNLCPIPFIHHRANKTLIKPWDQGNTTVSAHFQCLPATLATLSASWLFAPLDRLGLRCLVPPEAERILRRCTSVALKKATMKGCLFWGPLRPISPATRGLILSPGKVGRENSVTGDSKSKKSFLFFFFTLGSV